MSVGDPVPAGQGQVGLRRPEQEATGQGRGKLGLSHSEEESMGKWALGEEGVPSTEECQAPPSAGAQGLTEHMTVLPRSR